MSAADKGEVARDLPGRRCAAESMLVCFGGPMAQGMMMTKKLYVGNLSFRVTSDDLRQLFSQYGSVTSASVISDRDTAAPVALALWRCRTVAMRPSRRSTARICRVAH